MSPECLTDRGCGKRQQQGWSGTWDSLVGYGKAVGGGLREGGTAEAWRAGSSQEAGYLQGFSGPLRTCVGGL